MQFISFYSKICSEYNFSDFYVLFLRIIFFPRLGISYSIHLLGREWKFSHVSAHHEKRTCKESLPTEICIYFSCSNYRQTSITVIYPNYNNRSKNQIKILKTIFFEGLLRLEMPILSKKF